MRERDGGFTLIELLVVIIIIGILAAIAIPVFLSQRQKAVDAHSKSDIHNLATEIETWAVDNTGGYAGANKAALTAAGIKVTVSKGVTLYIVQHTAKGYCLAAYDANGSAPPPTGAAGLTAVEWWWDSQNGGLQRRDTPLNPTGCPVTTGFATDWQQSFTG